jgi:integrase
MKEFKVTIGSSKEQVFINVVFKGNRFRYSNGKSIGLNIKAKDDPELLCNAFKIKLLEGWEPNKRKYKSPSHDPIQYEVTLLNRFESVVKGLTETEYSYHHIRDCKWVYTNFKKYLIIHDLTEITPTDWRLVYLKDFINSNNTWSNRTKKNVLTTFRFLSRELDLDLSVRLSKSKSILHRKIDNLSNILDEIRLKDTDLYLAALITYGCLLRPHKEIRLLKWSEIDLERGLISLDGSRNKTGRNRIVPIPNFVLQELRNTLDINNDYVFGNGYMTRNKDYFKTKWTRYKRSSKFDLTNVTLYSFRHTGAINVFEKTGSIQKVKEVMGHSNLQATLIYLRGLDTTYLSVNDMPTLKC